MASPECHPFAKVGGLGDVVGALPKILARNGHDVRVCLPLYGSITPEKSWHKFGPIPVRLGYGERTCMAWEHKENGVIYYFIDCPHYYGSPCIYQENWYNSERFAFFCRTVLDLCRGIDWLPNVLHCHDWTTGLIPVYLNTTERSTPLNAIATVFTIHNLQHQGMFAPDILAYAGLPFSEFRADSLEALGAVNFMKGGLYHATKLTTVSPQYAKEIQTPEFGCGLENVLKFKAGDLIGILNGIDTQLWDPETDPHLMAHYDAHNLANKSICKKHLQQRLKLPEQPHAPLVGVISRLYDQKGLDVFMDVLPFVLQDMPFQVVMIGSGDPHWEYRMSELAHRHPDCVYSFVGYDDALAHQVEAGCDLFMMPSRFEPCGLNQMYSMRYGTLPIVHATGGLMDTVQSLDETTGDGCGFSFECLCNDAIYNTLGWACFIYYDRPDVFQKMQRSAMQKDFSWETSVKGYESVYRWAIEQRRLSR